ncbi:DNA-directed RNA polymerase subunit alpha C-terminal domain-containing protein [Gimesia maris]|uniref:DNA-directed RNA polymerase subunit alpha C-terminal domain-containing protein n=1 Tax=Gimesia maris TaxID=122 RepID=UPI0021BC1A7B|nr:DNA-directed RNA polymerase subunit alpha C-terminal domain-containing protein [Gimesia maris]
MKNSRETALANSGMSVRTVNYLKEHKVHTIGDLVKLKQEDLLSIPNFGEQTLQECIDLFDRLKVPNPGWEIVTKKNNKKTKS